MPSACTGARQPENPCQTRRTLRFRLIWHRVLRHQDVEENRMTIVLARPERDQAGVDGRDQPPAPHRAQWRVALRALRRLLGDPDDTAQVFEIMRALNPPATRRGYLRLIGSPSGARLAYERTELAGRLMDRDWLAQFAPGTVGAAYRDFVRSENLSADGLVKESQRGLRPGQIDAPSPIAWYGRRIRDVHDIWHILTGYGRDPLGEACLVAFSYSQTRGLGWLTIALGAAIKGGSGVPGVRRAIVEGFRHGRRSAWLPGVDYAALMAEPLEAARDRLGIARPVRYRQVVAHVRAARGA
jgi:ubiquinone biosynthesis protein COQ4